MQCNTNYTGQKNNLNYVNLNVLDTFKNKYKNSIILGLSDHTFGHVAVLGAVAKGARVIEKHFTDDRSLKRTDYHSALNKNEIKTFIENFNRIIKTLKPLGEFNQYEKKYRKMFKKSVASNKVKKKGEKINRKDLIFIKEKKI